MNYLLGISQVPQVSFWDGIVMGGGVGLSIFGDYRVATENSLFAMPECSIGIFPDVGSSSWMPKIKGPGVGMYLGLTGMLP
jgi:enoyl-CoA hydratase/carnithine racemase